jgi:hypothetical protein
MLHDLRTIPFIASCAILAGCSGAPRTAEPGVSAAAPTQPAPQTIAAANNAPATAPAAARASDVDASLVKAGYSVMRRHDVVLYCRNEIITGQRIATRVCLTAAQIQTEKQNVTKANDLMRQGGNRCVKPACGD